MASWAASWVRRFSVDETSRHKGGFTIYKITSVLFPIASPEAVTIVSVWKRYSDIQQLHKSMRVLHAALHLKGKLPEFAQWSYFRRFDAVVIEERKATTKRLLEFVAEHRLLFTSAEFVNFLQTGYPEPVPPGGGVINAIRTSLHLPIEETPPLEYQSTDEEVSPAQPTLELQRQSTSRTDNVEVENQKDDTALDISEIEIYEAADVEFKTSPAKLSTIESFDSLSSWGSGNSNFYDEVDQVDTSERIIKRRINVLPDLITFDEPSTSRGDFDDYHTMDKTHHSNNNSMNTSTSSIRNPNSETTSQDAGEFATRSEVSSLTGAREGVSAVKGDLIGVKSDNVTAVKREVRRSDSRTSLYSRKSHGAISYANVDTKVRTEDSYVFEAGYMLNLGARCEDIGDYPRAFECYKSGIEKMLIGVQSDTDPSRRNIIKDKTNKYLAYAESIYRNHLTDTDGTVLGACEEERRVERAALPASMLRGAYEELALYRVLCALPPRAMLVLHRRDQHCYAVKVIQKIPNNLTEFDEYIPQNSDTKKPILPTNVPYMVQLKSYIETPNLIFLILDYAPGGKLLDYIANYVKSAPSTPAREVNLENVFSEPTKHKINEQKGKIKKVNDEMCNNININNKYKDKSRTSDKAASVVNEKGESLKRTDKSDLISEFVMISRHEENNITGVNDRISDEARVMNTQTESLRRTEESDIVNELVMNSQRLLMNVEDTLAEDEKSVDVVDRAGVHEKAEPKLKNSEVVDILKKDLKLSPERSLSRQVLPPSSVCKWGAELLTAIEHLHNSGVICRDLNPSNLLLGERGQLTLTYFVGYAGPEMAAALLHGASVSGLRLYVAPELYRNVTQDETGGEGACDFWSYGAIMYELLCGLSLSHYHKSTFTSHTILRVPDGLPMEQESLLTQLLTYEPSERLGAGKDGITEIKMHPYFKTIDWGEIVDSWVAPD